MVIERQLNGAVQQTFAPQGFDAQLIVPFTHERWPGASVRRPAGRSSTLTTAALTPRPRG